MESDLRDLPRSRPADTSTAPGPIGRGRAAAALISVCLGFFVIQLDVTIVNVALPAIQGEIGGSLAGLQWVVDAYTLALAAIMLTAGSTADRVRGQEGVHRGPGRVRGRLGGLRGRPGAGRADRRPRRPGPGRVGHAALLAGAAGAPVPRPAGAGPRARRLGRDGLAGVALGPVAGGVLVTVAGWRSIFLVNVPICLLTIALLRRYADESPKNPDRRADVPGLLLGVTMLAALTASFITAGQQGWLAPLPGALLGAGLLTAWLFLRAERRHPHPLLPLALFRSPNFSGATAVGMIFNLVLYGSLLCLSLYLQAARHESVLATGLLLLPSSVVVGLGSLASGRLTARLGPRPPMIAGLTLAAAGTALLATAGTSTPLALILAGSLLIGLISLAMPAMTAAVVGAAGPEHAGVASGVLNAARQSGGALGVAVLGSLLGQGHALSLHVPLLVATAGYLIAVALVCVVIRDR